ncbi:MAG: hypothetical protein U9O20_04680 [Patescibacteria group bacterium]|nr:hypothetical protein [Patescibacteria group bacterium]
MSQINKKQWNFLKKTHSRDNLSQAYLFVGPEDVGKFDLAIDFIGLVNELKSSQWVQQGQNPDVFLVKPVVEKKSGKIRKKDISIEQIKEVAQKLKYYAYQEKFKVLVVKEAQRMTHVAANSLLKTIEEPSKDLMIILVSDNEQQILSTIKSRCQIVRFGLAQKEKIKKHLKKSFSSQQEGFLDDCVALSGGRVRLAQNFANDKELFEQFSQIRDDFRTALKGGLLNGLKLSEEHSADREKLLQSMSCWIQYLRDFLVDGLVRGFDKNVSKKVFYMLEELIELRSQIQNTNINQRVQLENFFVKIS